MEMDSTDPAKEKKEIEKARRQFSSKALGLPPDVLLDTVLSNLQYGVTGNDKLGYQVRIQSLGARTQVFFIVKRAEAWKIVGSGQDPWLLGKEVLSRIAQNDFASAQQWLDWARENVRLGGGDDPVGGHPFPRFWNRGDEANPDKMKAAAYALLCQTESARNYIPQLRDLRAKATSDSDQVRLEIALAHAYMKAEDWNDLKPIADRLFAAYPTSTSALGFVVASALNTDDFARWQAAAEIRSKRLPDDMVSLRSLSQLATAQRDFNKSRSILRAAIDAGRGDHNDLNSYAWESLFTGKVTDEDLELAQRATTGDGAKDYNILHTLACIYAELGKGKEARDALLQAIKAGGLAEPDSSIWYGFGRIAELYGLNSVASTIYSRVEKPEKRDSPDSTYQLSRLRLKLMAAQTPATGAGKN